MNLYNTELAHLGWQIIASVEINGPSAELKWVAV